jgi:Flp pilus assembly protein TadG
MIARGWGTKGRGQALVEFALVIPLVFLLIFAAVDFGRAIYAYNTVSESARQANRTAIIDQTAANVVSAAITAAPALGLVASNVTICYKTADTLQKNCLAPATDDCATALQIGCLAFVTTTATYRPITPVISGLVGAIQLSSTSVGPIEYVCPTTGHPTCP